MAVTFTINNQPLEINNPDNLGLKLFSVFSDSNNIDSRSGTFTYTITIPLTDNNSKLFNHIEDYQTIDKFRDNIDYKVQIYCNEFEILRGTFYLDEISRDGIKGSIVSDIIDWTNFIDGRSLREIKSFTALEFSGATSIKTFNSNLVTSDIAFPLIPRGNFYYQDNRPSRPTQTLPPLAQNLIPVQISYQDIPPSVKLLSIVKKIFNDVGMEATGSIFFDDEINNIVIPFTGDDYQYNWPVMAKSEYTSNQVTRYFAECRDWNGTAPDSVTGQNIKWVSSEVGEFRRILEVEFDVIFNNKINDVGLNYDETTRTYIAPATGEYNISLSTSVYLLHEIPHHTMLGIFKYTSVGYDNAGCLFFEKGVPQNISDLSEQYGNLIAYTDLKGKQGQRVELNKTVYLEKGEAIKFIISAAPRKTIMFKPDEPTNVEFYFDMRLGSASLNITPNFGEEKLNIAQNLPDISQKDFMKSFINMFNLYFTVNNNVITFYKKDEFLLDNSYAIEITDKVDIKEAIITKPNTYSNFTFSYTEDSNDFLLKPNPLFANYSIKNNSGSDTKEIKLLFAPTKLKEFQYWGVSSYLNLPTIASEDALTAKNDEVSWSFGGTPRILKLVGTFGFKIMIDGIQNDILFSQFEDGIVYYNTIITQSNTSQTNLNWNGDKGLFKKSYYNSFYQSDRSHLLSMPIRLSESDYITLKSNVPVTINNDVYSVEQIQEFDPFNNTAQITLKKKI